MPGGRDRLEEADEHSVALLAEVPVAGEVLDDRQITMDACHRLGEQVVVLCCLERHVDSGLAGELPGPQAAGEHDRIGLDRARVGRDSGDAPAGSGEAGDGNSLDDGCAAHPGALRHRRRYADRVSATFIGDIGGANDVVDLGERKELADLLGRDDLIRHPVADLEVALANEGLEPLGARRDREVAHGAKSSGVTGLLLEAGIQVA